MVISRGEGCRGRLDPGTVCCACPDGARRSAELLLPDSAASTEPGDSGRTTEETRAEAAESWARASRQQHATTAISEREKAEEKEKPLRIERKEDLKDSGQQRTRLRGLNVCDLGVGFVGVGSLTPPLWYARRCV